MKSAIPKRGRSFLYAFRGIGQLYTQPNAWIQTVIALLMLVFGFIVGLEIIEWLAVVICIGTVLAAEAFNTAIEKLCDHLHPEQHDAIRKVKDISAGAVLIVSVSAAVCGVLVLLNHYYDFF